MKAKVSFILLISFIVCVGFGSVKNCVADDDAVIKELLECIQGNDQITCVRTLFENNKMQEFCNTSNEHRHYCNKIWKWLRRQQG